jgi:hypothetical protein
VSEDFLRRWARLKRASNAAPAKADVAQPAPELPALDNLTFESDFKDFMHSKVEESVKRAALKKLFADPRFNVMDGLDTYIDDYSKEDPISQELLAQLEHAKQALFVPKEEEEKPVVAEESQEKPNVDPAQNT